MGNHVIGVEIGRAAETAINRLGKFSALEILDEICLTHKNCDVEFEAVDPKNPGKQHPEYDDYRDPSAPLGKLMLLAFAPDNDHLDLSDENYFEWSDKVGQPFNNRYNFW